MQKYTRRMQSDKNKNVQDGELEPIENLNLKLIAVFIDFYCQLHFRNCLVCIWVKTV